jgi:hypothetical protein
MKIFLAVLLMTLVLPTVVDARRTHVRVSKPYYVERPTQPIAVPIAIIPPLAIFYDLQRRTSCEGDVLGLGGPGFTEPMPVGNVMIPAVNRSACAAAPRRVQ